MRSRLNDIVVVSITILFKSLKRDIIVLVSSQILYVSISFPVNNGKEMSLPGFRIRKIVCVCRYHNISMGGFLTQISVWQVLNGQLILKTTQTLYFGSH